MSDLEGFPRVCHGCNQKVAPTSKKHPRPHWFQTNLETGEKLSYHFEHHPLISGSLSEVRSVKSSESNFVKDDGRYATIVADPPWQIPPTLGVGGRRKNKTAVPYSFMSLDAICELDAGSLAAPDAALFLWSTRKVFREGDAAKVARAWGFEPCGEIVWGLKNPGSGDYATGLVNDHEPILVATRGKAVLNAGEPLGVWFWKQVYEYGPSGVPQKVHSAKPPGFLELVERISPGPYLEMFAREARLGWDAWGDESLGHVSLGAA